MLGRSRIRESFSGSLSGMSVILFFLFISCRENSVGVPEIETVTIADITSNTAVSGGIIRQNGGSEISDKGVCWGPDSNPTISDQHTAEGSGSNDYVSRLINLLPNTAYHARAYAINNEGVGYGDDKELITLSGDAGNQIIADHTVVDQFDRIPASYLNEIKKMWLVVAGESHAEAYRTGLLELVKLFPDYAVSITNYESPEGYSSSHLRASSATWGDVDHSAGWIYSYGEEDWCVYTDPPTFQYNPNAVLRTKAGLTYCNTNDLVISAFGFIWCYDAEVDIPDYLKATQEYVDHCILNGYSTKVFFTTGPVDDYLSIGQNAWENYLRWEEVREYIKLDAALILFDYADILCYDNDGQLATTTWDGHMIPVIHPSNASPDQTGHISAYGALRLAKAVWWMLARMAGWDGNSE